MEGRRPSADLQVTESVNGCMYSGSIQNANRAIIEPVDN